jgi:hypothetical protein
MADCFRVLLPISFVLLHAPCPMLHAPCPLPHALCPMPHAPCPMPYALCPMPYALCPMRFALFPSSQLLSFPPSHRGVGPYDPYGPEATPFLLKNQIWFKNHIWFILRFFFRSPVDSFKSIYITFSYSYD